MSSRRGFFLSFLVFAFSVYAGKDRSKCQARLNTKVKEDQGIKTLELYQQSLSIFRNKCATCHFGLGLSFVNFPFESNRRHGSNDQFSIVKDAIRRARLPEYQTVASGRIAIPNKERMPPLNAPQLTDDELKTLEQWLNLGLPES
ncbi:hypothetical protein GW915_07945 [bacterium]|nr:hypothetical protein [bacterium]